MRAKFSVLWDWEGVACRAVGCCGVVQGFGAPSPAHPCLSLSLLLPILLPAAAQVFLPSVEMHPSDGRRKSRTEKFKFLFVAATKRFILEVTWAALLSLLFLPRNSVL